MKNVKILDCTLRDGGRIIDCAFPDSHIKGITKGLTNAKIDIVELGFLRGNIEYSGNSTFFNEVEQFKPFIPENKGNTMYVAFADYGKEYGMWDFSKLPECDGISITGIRIGYRKKDLHDAVEIFELVKAKGYTLFIQGVDSLSYTDKEMLEAIEIINQVKPYSFGVVDTYGAMYKDDVIHYYNLVDYNLNEDIAIDFHSHNNLQLSFSFSQEVIELSKGKREIILDATLEGVGKGTGNLNSELIMDFLIRKKYYNYDLDVLLDTIDEYLHWIKEEHSWDYTIPYAMAGIYSSHANNIIYLNEKHKLRTKDIKQIISMIEPQKRKRYDYDNIESLYLEYLDLDINDQESLKILQKKLENQRILILVPGASIGENREVIQDFINRENPVVISVNFIADIELPPERSFVFYGNPRRYLKDKKSLEGRCVIVSSNVVEATTETIVVNYNGLVKRGVKYFDNSVIILLNLLKKVGFEQIVFAGFDGFEEGKKNYIDASYESNRYEKNYNQINNDLTILLKEFANTLKDKHTVQFLTGSRFSGIFK
ncbi:MAG: hypothetical protein HFI29_06680 [Lachnospiraceae bacterium]|jgi:4-hydroxy 2-oxovalerate aldolase|nr:hypothetical protein [Lachnospiraceae bacterium]